ncbi:MAG: hypothetical protein K6E84_08175 [Lachnospiraceae bacterium]|nr:hypothetical protein [Lachnospiraceae bacterium]
MNENKRKVAVIGFYALALIIFLIFVYLEKREYTAVDTRSAEEVEGVYTDMTDTAVFKTDTPVDSDYLALSGFAYWPQLEYKTIRYAVALRDCETNDYLIIPSLVVDRPDLFKKHTDLIFEKVGFYGRISKKIGRFGERYYEICFLADINENLHYIVHTGSFCGTPKEGE